MIRALESTLGGVEARARAARRSLAGFADFGRFSSAEKKDLPVGKFSSYIICRV
jgi:hypothetical protein